MEQVLARQAAKGVKAGIAAALSLAGQKRFEDAQAALSKLQSLAARHGLADELKRAQGEVRQGWHKAVKDQIGLAASKATLDLFPAALDALQKLSPVAQKLGGELLQKLKSREKVLREAQAKRVSTILEELKLAVELDDPETVQELVVQLRRVFSNHPETMYYESRIPIKQRTLKVAVTARGAPKLVAKALAYGDAAQQKGTGSVEVKPTQQASRLVLQLSGLPQGRWHLYLYIRADKGSTLEVRHRSTRTRRVVKQVGVMTAYDATFSESGGTARIELIFSSGTRLTLSSVELERAQD